MEIFEIRGGYVFPTVECLSMEPFRRIWYNDTSPDKGDAEKVFRYTNFMCNPVLSNPFFGIKDDEERARAVKKEIWGDEEYPATIDMVQCCMKFDECLHMNEKINIDLLEGAIGAASGLTEFFKTINYNLRTPNGAPMYKPKDVQSSITVVKKAVEELKMMRRIVHEEIKVATKTTNDREPNTYEE